MRDVIVRRLGGFALCLAVALAVWLQASPVQAQPGFAPSRFAAIAVDQKSGKVLYARSADARRYPASLTKVMTLYLAFDDIESGRMRLKDRVVMSPHAAAQAPVKLGLRAGGSLTVEQALNIIVVKSANDVAVALAEHISGTEAAFVKRMNRKARALGMKSTHFANPSGLPDRRNVSTARDLARLGRALLRDHPESYEIFDQRSTTFAGRTIRGHNRLLREPGVDGIKTGYIRASGFNIMTSARREGRRLVVVVLGADSASVRDRFTLSLLKTTFKRLKADEPKTRVAAASPAPSRDSLAGPDEAAWWLQVGAYRSQDLAVARVESLARLYPRRLGGVDQWLDEVDGMFNTRFRMGSAHAAEETCDLLKSKGEDCFWFNRSNPA